MKATDEFAARRTRRAVPILVASVAIALGLILGLRVWLVDLHIRRNTARLDEGMHKTDVVRLVGRPHDGQYDHNNWTYYLLNSWDAMHIHFDDADNIDSIAWY